MATAFFADSANQSRPFAFRAYKAPDVVDALRRLFRGKCAYCEGRVDVEAMPDIEHFRPRAAAVGLDGRTIRPGYWWLAGVWMNLYLTCQRCNRNKANRFPVAGRRATAPGEPLGKERAVLLDPCLDEPRDHLVFYEDGFVASRSKPTAGVDRGAITIDVLGLNRASLVTARREAAEALENRLKAVLRKLRTKRDLERNAGKVLASALDLDRSYVALQHQLGAEMLADWMAGAASDEVQLANVKREEAKRDDFFVRQRAHEEDLQRASVEQYPDLESIKSQALEAVELVNFRGIDRLEVQFGAGSAEQAGWTMLLGENGVGKSSVLQAVAIALMGEARFNQSEGDIRPADLLRRGTSKGHVRLFFSAHPEPIEVGLTPTGIEFGATAAHPRMCVLGFGSSRWLPREGGFAPDRGDFVRIANLFNPFVPLADTMTWLSSIDPKQFKRMEERLLSLLQLDAGEQLVRVNGDILVHAPRRALKRAVSLRQLSDGYQSVMSMVGDIMDLLRAKRIDMAVAEGVVLVDEIGAHLHPAWKMQVVSRLRAAFPKLQFIASTHDPLCLRGLHDDEVALLRRDSRGRVVRVGQLPPVETLRVDQLLTSPYFGLHSTMDPAVEALFDEYNELLAQERLTKQQRQRRNELRKELASRELLGSTRREREMLDAIDMHLAREADALADKKDQLLKKETSDVLASILKKMDREAGEVLS